MRKMLVFAAVMMGMMASGAWAVTIDNFNEGPFSLTDSTLAPPTQSVSNSQSGLLSANVIGNRRDTYGEITLNVNPSIVQIQVTAGGNLVMSVPDDANATLYLNYGSFINPLHTGGAVAEQLSEDWTTLFGITFTVNNADLGGSAHAHLQLDVDGLGLVYSSIATAIPAGGGVFQIPWSDFGLTAAQLTDVDGVAMHFEGPDSWDFNLNLVATTEQVGIPEPATISLLALGALGLLRRRRKS